MQGPKRRMWGHSTAERTPKSCTSRRDQTISHAAPTYSLAASSTGVSAVKSILARAALFCSLFPESVWINRPKHSGADDWLVGRWAGTTGVCFSLIGGSCMVDRRFRLLSAGALRVGGFMRRFCACVPEVGRGSRPVSVCTLS